MEYFLYPKYHSKSINVLNHLILKNCVTCIYYYNRLHYTSQRRRQTPKDCEFAHPALRAGFESFERVKVGAGGMGKGLHTGLPGPGSGSAQAASFHSPSLLCFYKIVEIVCKIHKQS